MIFILLFTALLIYLFIVYKRAKKYKYDTSKDYVYNLDKHLIYELKTTNKTFILEDNYKDFDSLFLKINLSFNINSYFFKPFIKIKDTKHFFEYGARGVRYLNISYLKEKSNELILKNLSLNNNSLSIYGYKNNINLSQKILILAPHADDAEIAAFGLYKTAKDITIVTTTAGEQGSCNYSDLYNNDRTANSLKKAELRVLDATTIPLLGNVNYENSITLGYFGGSLKWMNKNRDKEATSNISGIDNMNLFRKVSHSNIKLDLETKPIYSSFLNDLEEILKQVKPDIIITPHPAIDSHEDHKYTTQITIEAMKNTKAISKLLLYTNHLELSESYPLGGMHSAVSIPPNTKEFYYDSIYSFTLNSNLQIDKFFALEAMHDLRDSLIYISTKKAFKHLNKMFKRQVTGKDKSYYKRAIRANELFFVVKNENIDKLK